jgi:hypothetical protein
VEQKNFGKQTDGTKAPYFDGSQLCAQVDPELFFPNNAGEAVKLKRLVIPICRKCSFQMQCLEYALNSDVYGIWAGTSETDRIQMRRQLGIRVNSMSEVVKSMLA